MTDFKIALSKWRRVLDCLHSNCMCLDQVYLLSSALPKYFVACWVSTEALNKGDGHSLRLNVKFTYTNLS